MNFLEAFGAGAGLLVLLIMALTPLLLDLPERRTRVGANEAHDQPPAPDRPLIPAQRTAPTTRPSASRAAVPAMR